MRLILTLLCLLAAAAPAAAEAIAANPNARVEIVAGPQRENTRTAAIVFRPREGWHTYWKNPGAAGVETRIEWTLPAGAEAAEARYPVPGRFVVAGIMNYVYEGENALLVDISGLEANAPQPFSASIDYLVCDDSICVPESAELSGDFRDVETGTAEIARFESALPRAADWPAAFSWQGERLRLSIDIGERSDVAGAYFFPVPDGALDYNAPQTVSRKGELLIVETLAGFDRSLTSLPGVLKLMLEDGAAIGARVEAVPGDVPASGAALAARPTGGGGSGGLSAAAAFLFALAGGLLLNIMPCVFPILSLKALALAGAGTDEAAARRDALAYSAGAILAVGALGAAILLLRAGGASVGWAFQLQDPRFILFLLLLVSAIALNLAGLFELPAPAIGGERLAGRGGASGSFWTGVLAAFVATPCTGPFMGAALGAALILSPPSAMAIFLGLGVGLALPFLAIGLIPALRRRIPKPGPWLETFRRVMSVPMFLTALALLWVLGRQAGVDGMTLGAGAALVLGLALWWAGKSRRRAVPLAAAAASLLALMFVPSQSPAARELAQNGLAAAEVFSPARLAALRARGEPVFLYFTADWCITCKVNERGALASREVAEAFAAADIRTMAGDWTRADPVITEFLASHGRAGVPLYLFYDGSEEPRILPQILSRDMLVGLAREGTV